ncbi:MAG: hypothetical protein QM737_21205 [Ferruginibacter sp.]
MKGILLAIFMMGQLFIATAQVGIGTSTPDNSAALEIKDSARGILIPRLTMAQRLAIQNPAQGLMVYQNDSTKGYWYYEGTKWKNIYGYAGNGPVGGKTTLLLSDTISNAQAQSVIDADFGPNTQELYIVGCTRLTTLTLPKLVNAINIFITDNSVLSSVNLPDLKNVAGHLYFANCPLLATVNMPLLQNILLNTVTFETSLLVYNTRIVDIDFPALKRVTGIVSIQNNPHTHSINFPLLEKSHTLWIMANQHLTSISTPLLTQSAYLWTDNNADLPALSFPALTSIGRFVITNNPDLTSIGFPVLTEIAVQLPTIFDTDTRIDNCRNLSTFDMGSLVKFSNTDFKIMNTKLSSATINNLLHNFVSIVPAIDDKNIRLSSQSPAAPPTGQGIIDKATLITNGNTVATD